MAYWARATLTVAGTLALLAAAWTVRNILLLVLVATVLAVGLDPQVRWLQRRRVSRPWAVAIIGLLSLGFLALSPGLSFPMRSVRRTIWPGTSPARRRSRDENVHGAVVPPTNG